MSVALVVPSIREHHLREFLTAWRGLGGWDAIYVVEDNPTKTFTIPTEHPDVTHYSWAEIADCLGEDAWIISKRDSAIRAFGFLAAYWGNHDFVITLDDDCFPIADYLPFAAQHVAAITTQPVWVESVPGRRTRGLPYEQRGVLQSVVANMGLWANVADDDAITTLALRPGHFTPPSGSRVIPSGQIVPLCGMNLAFNRHVTPLFYFPLMGEGQPYRRMDDIWAGVISQTLMAHLGWSLAVGEPFVEHRRASDPMTNLVKEAPGVAFNEFFWKHVRRPQLTQTDPIGCVDELGTKLPTGAPNEYTARLGDALRVWASLFVNRPTGL